MSASDSTGRIEVGQWPDGTPMWPGSRSGKLRLVDLLAFQTDRAYAFDAKDTDEDTRTNRPAPRRTVRRSCQPRPVTDNNPVPTGTLSEIAAIIAARLREAGFNSDEAIERNVLYTGQARRTGTLAELAAELADVVITAHVAAHEMALDLGAYYWPPSAVHYLTTERWVRLLFVRAGRFVDNFVDGCDPTSPSVQLDLVDVVAGAHAVAQALGIDLDAAIAEKLTVVFTRGWRESGDQS